MPRPLCAQLNNHPRLRYHERMNFGITHFDNLGFAIIALFQITTLEGWVCAVLLWLSFFMLERHF